MGRTTRYTVVLIALFVGCGKLPTSPSITDPEDVVIVSPSAQQLPGQSPPNSDQPAVPPVSITAAGDVGWCGLDGARQTGELLSSTDGLILALGDLAYPNGSDGDFSRCFDPFWGKYRDRIRPVPGNHEYQTPNSAGYFNYFGPLPVGTAGPNYAGYYSFDYGPWHIVALNSEIDVGDNSPQLNWLKNDLVQSRGRRCTLAYWHRPFVSSGQNGNNPKMAPVWRVLQAGGVEVVLAGHDHLYERFSPLDWQERVNPSEGVRQFVVGTGGASLYGYPSVKLGSEVIAPVWGVLQMDLRSDGYSWNFLAVSSTPFTDSGTDYCR